MKDLAILIPVFNDQESLINTLESIRETDNSFTVVVVDDGSAVPIEVERERYPFEIVTLRQAENGGIISALNTGLDYIRSCGFTFIARLDAADRNRPMRFSKQLERLAAHPDLHMLGSNATFRDESDGSEILTTQLPLQQDKIRRAIVFRTCFIHPTIMLRTECLDAVGQYDTKFPHIEDYVLFSRIAARFRSENLEEVLVDCSIRAGGISVKNHRRQLLSGLRFQLQHPRPLNYRWYAYLAKRLAYFIVPLRIARPIKTILGITRPIPQKQSVTRQRKTIRT